MDRTSDKQWLHDIRHVGIRMGILVNENSTGDGDGGLFAQYMNTCMKIKMEASGYPSHCDRDQEKTSTLNVYEPTTGLHCVRMTFHSMQDVV